MVGVAMGVAASLFLSSKKGKQLTKEAKEGLADFYAYIAPKIKKMKKMGEKEYKAFMKSAVEQYAKTKKMSEQMAKELIKETQQSWKHFSRHLGK